MNGDSGVTTKDLAVTLGAETETYDETGPLRSTAGHRAGVLTASLGGSGSSFARATWWTRSLDEDTLRATRLTSGDAWVGFAQQVETAAVVAPEAGSPALHVTRSVFNLRDEVAEVWDARGLTSATWLFTYDQLGRKLKSEHTTGTGIRYALPDAAGNPIWSRDALDVEVDRTFDALNRPLTESSDDGTTVKLRRMWSYVAYDDNDTTSKDANLFGRVEEARDQDGLRYFEYDWRGLVTQVSHKFWDADWTNASDNIYANTDEAAIVSTDRGSLSTWLALTDLTDTTTVVVTTTYDAAGRPLVETFPEGMTRTWSYNAAGQLDTLAYDRGTGSGDEVAVQDVTYNARGQVTGYVHGNDVACVRTYDTDTERLTLLKAYLPGSPDTRFQQLSYTYDPVGNPVLIVDDLEDLLFVANQVVPNTRTFRYDPRYRLSRSTGKRHTDATDGVDAPVTPTPSPEDYVPYTHRYSYDEVGNFTTNQEYKSGTNNLDYKSGLPDLFDGWGSESYSYDSNGCCTATPRHSALGYAFDAQPVFVDMGGGTVVRYRRHTDQRAVRFVSKSGVKGLSLYLGPWEYHRRVATTSYVKATLHVGSYARAEVVLSGTDASSLPVFHVHSDHLGSAQALTKADGTLLCQESFFAYGRSSDRRDARNRYRYIGVERDEETGFAMTGPRTYDPVTGRFYQRDPVGGLELFVYSRANPVRRFDPSGYQDPESELDQWAAETERATEARWGGPATFARQQRVAENPFEYVKSFVFGAIGQGGFSGSPTPGDRLAQAAGEMVSGDLAASARESIQQGEITPELEHQTMLAAGGAAAGAGVGALAGRLMSAARRSRVWQAASRRWDEFMGFDEIAASAQRGLNEAAAPFGSIGRVQRGSVFSRYWDPDLGHGVLAQLEDDGFLELYIKVGPDTPRGGQMFREALAAFGGRSNQDIRGIRGIWNNTSDISTNFDAYRAALGRGLSPEEAVFNTFTGEMSRRHGFVNGQVTSDQGWQVIVEFTR